MDNFQFELRKYFDFLSGGAQKTWEIRLAHMLVGWDLRNVAGVCVHWLVPLVANIFRSISRRWKKEEWADQAESRSCGAKKKTTAGGTLSVQ